MFFDHLRCDVEVVEKSHVVVYFLLLHEPQDLVQEERNHLVLHGVPRHLNSVSHRCLELAYEPLRFLGRTHFAHDYREVRIQCFALNQHGWSYSTESAVVWQKGPVLVVSDLMVKNISEADMLSRISHDFKIFERVLFRNPLLVFGLVGFKPFSLKRIEVAILNVQGCPAIH